MSNRRIGVRMCRVFTPLAVLALTGICGCRTVYPTHQADGSELSAEGSLVFVRPDRYTLLGTRSLRDYCEVTYERLSENAAGQPVVKFGLRNKGGQHWWDLKGPRIVVAAKAVFFESPLTSGAIKSPPVYETNWQRLPMTRGETIHYSFVCPVKTARGYQVTLSDSF